MVLTVFTIENAKPREKPYKLSDGNGLALLVEANGSKLWRFRYRFGGKENMLTFGAFPDVGLAAARDKRNEARKLIAAGTDPAKKRKDDRQTAATVAAETFGVIAEEYIAKLEAEGAVESTISKNRWLLQHLGKPLVDRPIRHITSAEILALTKSVEKSGRRHSAHRLRGSIGSVFRFAIANLKAENDPTFALRGSLLAPTVQHRAAITDETKLGALMQSIDEYDGWPTLKAALQLTALTMARPGEIRHMRRSEIVWPKAMWNIPAERMKMRRPHDVPLSRQALAVLRDVWDLSPGSDLVLPSIRSNKNTGLNQLGKKASQLLGRYFIAMTMNAALTRSTVPKSEWHPTFLMVDEFQEFVDEEKTPELLRLIREYQVGAIVAHHTMHSQEINDALRTAISTNTTIKYSAAPQGSDVNYMARDLNCTPEFLTSVRRTDKQARFACYIKAGIDDFHHAIPVNVPWKRIENPKILMPVEAHMKLRALNDALVGPTPASVHLPIAASPPVKSSPPTPNRGDLDHSESGDTL